MLTDAQKLLRRGKITASRAAALLSGDDIAIDRLWLMVSECCDEEDLSTVWPVRLGEATEQLNLDWFEQRYGTVVDDRGVVVYGGPEPWIAATLDGWSVKHQCPVEAKHVGGFEPIGKIIERYQPQVQWQMLATGAEQCALSVIMGAKPPRVEFIPRDQALVNEMLERATEFMECVKQGRPPKFAGE